MKEQREILQIILEQKKLTISGLSRLIKVNRSYLSALKNHNKLLNEKNFNKLFEFYKKINKKVSIENGMRNLRCRNGCYFMKVLNKHLVKAFPKCPICGCEMAMKRKKLTRVDLIELLNKNEVKHVNV
jgi:hypothetical protein